MWPSSSSGVGTTRTSADEPGSRQAGVIGSPIAHSLSPALHRAAYAALGLTGWRYHREEVRAGELATYLAGRPVDWIGLSVTMPGKEEALAAAGTASDVARLTGSANTLVRDGEGWAADNTDVYGIRASLLQTGMVPDTARRAMVVGSGATARSAIAALHGLGVREILLVVRTQARPQTLELTRRLGLDCRVAGLDEQVDGAPVDLAVSTVPADAVPGAGAVPRSWQAATQAGVALDVVYRPWPTPWARHLVASGATVIPGVELLTHQAARQVELMTGRAAPLEAMRQSVDTEPREPVR